MARYQGQVAIFRATVPLGVKTPACDVRRTDRRRQVHRRRSGRNSASSRRNCAPTRQFIRRVYLDITGTLPTPKQVHGLRRRQGRRRSATSWSTSCSTRPEYTYYFANKWADILRVKRRQQPEPARHGTFAFHDWIREASPPTSPTTSSSARSSPPSATRRRARRRSGTRSSTTARAVRGRHRARCSSACGWPAPSATTTRTRSGARTTTGASPRSSAASAARTCRSRASTRTSSRRRRR